MNKVNNNKFNSNGVLLKKNFLKKKHKNLIKSVFK